MSRQSIYIIVAAVVVFVVILVVAFLRGPGGTISPGLAPGGVAAPAGPTTREAAPKNIVVPGKDAENVPENVAVPETVSIAGVNRGDASFRSFKLNVEGNKFEPDTVIVKIGDTVRIDITAVDKNYDFFQPDYGLKVTLAKGETKFSQFDATAAGKFLFFCQSCGGPEKGPRGYLIVAPKE